MTLDTHMHINSTVFNDPYTYIEIINKDGSTSHAINVRLNIETSRETVNISIANEKNILI